MPLTLDTSVPPPDGPEDPPTPMSPLRSPTLFAVERPFTPKSSRFSFTEAEAGARWTAGLAVVAVGGLFAVFAAISRKGRGAARVVKEGYGATDSTVDVLLA